MNARNLITRDEAVDFLIAAGWSLISIERSGRDSDIRLCLTRDQARQVIAGRVEAGQILTSHRDRKPVRVEQISEVPGRGYVTPVKYSEQYGIVRAGQSYWADLSSFDPQ